MLLDQDLQNQDLQNQDLQSVIQAEARPNEKILWIAQPDPLRIALHPSMIACLLFGIVWTSFTVNFQYMCTKGAGPHSTSFWGFNGIASDLFMLPFLAIGLTMIFSPVSAFWKARKTIYAITTERIFIVQQGRTRHVETYGASDIGTIERVERADRTGTLTFGQKTSRDSDGDKQTRAIQFIGIPNVHDVEILIRATFLDAK